MKAEDIIAMEPGNKLDGMVSQVVFGKPPLQNWSRDGENVVCSFMTYSFSTDIAAAWSVLEKMEQETKVSVWSDNNRKWACEVEYMIHDDCETAPEAICKAALLYKLNARGRSHG